MARWGNTMVEVISMPRQQLVPALVRGASLLGPATMMDEALSGLAEAPFALLGKARTMSHKSADITTGGASHE